MRRSLRMTSVHQTVIATLLSGSVRGVAAGSPVGVGLAGRGVGGTGPPLGSTQQQRRQLSRRAAMVRACNWRAAAGIACLITTDDDMSLVSMDRPHPRPIMVRRLIALVISGALIVGLASVALAADPNDATGHGAEVSAVAKAVHAVRATPTARPSPRSPRPTARKSRQPRAPALLPCRRPRTTAMPAAATAALERRRRELEGQGERARHEEDAAKLEIGRVGGAHRRLLRGTRSPTRSLAVRHPGSTTAFDGAKGKGTVASTRRRHRGVAGGLQ